MSRILKSFAVQLVSYLSATSALADINAPGFGSWLLNADQSPAPAGIVINDANTPGDETAMYRITEPGDYILDSTVWGAVGKNGIVIEADGVTIDLMGHSLRGVPGSLDGILSVGDSTADLVVRNGTIADWGRNDVSIFGYAPAFDSFLEDPSGADTLMHVSGTSASVHLAGASFEFIVGEFVLAVHDFVLADLRDSTLVIDSFDAVHTLEVMSADRGSTLDALANPDEGQFSFGTVRIERGTVMLVDLYDNDARGQIESESMYVSNLEIAPDATLITDGRRVYYEMLSRDGVVDDLMFLAPITRCRWDIGEDDFVGGDDLSILLAQWGTDGSADFDDNGVVDGGDLAHLLTNWGPCR